MVQTLHICSTGADLPVGDPKRCGKPAILVTVFRISKLRLYACGHVHKQEFGEVLKGLIWNPIEEAAA